MSRWRLKGSAIGSVAVLLALMTWTTPAYADAIRERQWFLDFLAISRVHGISDGAGVTVAVIDSGVDAHHPDLSGNVLSGAVVLPGAKGDAWNDQDGHGTNMAGLIAAHGHGDNDGALGIAPKSKILPVKDKATDDTGIADNMAAAINVAIARGAQVISISQGAGETESMKSAIQRALAADIVVIAAAGNKPDSAIVEWPAHYDGVVAVAAVDQKGHHVALSITGPQVVLSAPGADIVSTYGAGSYAAGTGTSPAAAIVAGVAALVRAKYPTMSATEVIHRLTATAIDKGPPGRDPEYGYGIVNPVAALTADVPPLQGSSSSAAGTRSARSTPAAERSGRSSTPLIAAVLIVGLVLGGLAGLAAMRRRASDEASK